MKQFFVWHCIPLAIVAMSFGALLAQDSKAKDPSKDKKIKIELSIDLTGGAVEKEPIPVDVAILLDTSNSMDGLINQARQQLWQIVLRLAEAEKKGRKPQIRVSIFEYGNTNLPATENFIRQVVPLTDDLDKVSEALFALKTRGGDEYCGAIIKEAITRLDWSSDADAYRVVFIAGNEPFTQGPVNYVNSCTLAVDKGIIVNTIHCGEESVGKNTGWSDGAERGGGKSFNINQDRQVHRIKSPQDQILIKLNAELNDTYLWYGNKQSRQSFRSNQLAQDSNSFSGKLVPGGSGIGMGGGMGMGGIGAGGTGMGPSAGFGARAKSKAMGVYNNQKRDLVDAAKSNPGVLKSVKKEHLPDEMQKMTDEQRKSHLQQVAAKRAELQKKILEVSAKRDAYIAEAKKKKAIESGVPAEVTLGDAVEEAIDMQINGK